MKNYFKIIGSRSQKAFLKKIDSKNKNKVLFKYQKLISLNEINILKENEKDLKIAIKKGLKENLLKRLSLDKKKILHIRKSILSIIHQGKEVYKISLNFDLSINANDSLIKTLKITSSLDFALLNKYSIAQRNKVINYNVNKLMKLIDEKITFQLNNKAFNKFVIM